MNFYFAPLEGLTGYLYRNAHHAFFDQIDRYYSPFIVPNQNGKLRTKELNDILPEHNKGMVLIPQILTNKAKDFIDISKEIKEYGYQELNLNLGCPSGTVVSKHRGAGFLSKREELDAFLEEIFEASITKISVKTRIGISQPEEFYELIEIYNKYPMAELIIHPRTREDYYKNKPHRNIFRDAISLSKNPICYNGDINTFGDYKTLTSEFPSVNSVMIGRGLLSNPGLVGTIKNNDKINKKVLKDFHDTIYDAYKGTLCGDTNVLFKMKELWFYMITMFTDNSKYAKKIRKSERLIDYDQAVLNLFREQELIEENNII